MMPEICIVLMSHIFDAFFIKFTLFTELFAEVLKENLP